VGGFASPDCALAGAGVNQPASNSPNAKVATIKIAAGNIVRRSASFNLFLLILNQGW
jgi:hypothetical protein